jgi:hypothetical protein
MFQSVLSGEEVKRCLDGLGERLAVQEDGGEEGCEGGDEVPTEIEARAVAAK